MAAVVGVRIKTSDLVAHIAANPELSEEISNVAGTDGSEHIEAAVSLMRDADKLMLVAPGVVELLEGTFEVSPDGSMTFYDPMTLEAAAEQLDAAHGEIGLEKRPICASLGIAEHHAISDVGDIAGLIRGLMDYHEDVVVDDIRADLFAKTMSLQAHEEGEPEDDVEHEPYVKPGPADPGEITGYAEVLSVRTGSAGMTVEVSVTQKDGDTKVVTFTGDEAMQALQAINALEGTYATTRVRVGQGGRALAFAIAAEDVDLPPFMDH